MIFRKVADVKREKELAEKRKNDPPLDLAADHPVRKLISRFRKISDNKLQVADLEKGDTKIDIVRPRPPANGKAHIINIDENPHPNQTSSMSKWGKFLAGAAQTPGGPPGGGLGGNPAHPRPAKPMSKFSKLLASKQDTIEEKPEEEEKIKPSSRNRVDFSDSGHDNISHQSDGALTQRDVVFSVGSHHNNGAISAAEQQLINSLYDIKLEIKEEIDVLNQKMNKIDYQINEIFKMFSPASSPYSSHTPSFSSRGAGGNSSVGSSTSSTASNSMVTSPKSSVPSSPHRHALENMPATSIDSSRTGTPPSRKGSAGSGSSIGNGSGSQGSGGSRKSSPIEQSASETSSRKSSKKSRKSSPGSRSKVAPFNDDTATQVVGGITPAEDDDNVPMKDRDLDIL